MDIDALIREAEEALEVEEYDRAQRAAEELVATPHPYGYELLARVHAGRGNLPRAIAVLQEGVAKFPRAWALWIYLGEVRSDNGDYDEALAAYDTALGVDGIDADVVHINAAIVHDRAGRPEDALMRLHEVIGADDEAAIAAARVRARILNDLDRPDAAIAAAQAGLARANDETTGDEIAPLHAAIAKASWARGDREAALQEAWEALRLHPDKSALWLVREIEAQYSEHSRYYRMSIRGSWNAEGYFRKFDVVAEDEEEALHLVARMEPEEVRASLSVHDVQMLEHVPDQPKGVYWCTGRVFFPEPEEQ
jgi:tetratricopeptide (TPR) repeat protein